MRQIFGKNSQNIFQKNCKSGFLIRERTCDGGEPVVHVIAALGALASCRIAIATILTLFLLPRSACHKMLAGGTSIKSMSARKQSIENRLDRPR
jgi:hypothetical protein